MNSHHMRLLVVLAFTALSQVAFTQAAFATQKTHVSSVRNGSNVEKDETVIRDTMARFTATAIVGNRASLRNNVGNNTVPTGSRQAVLLVTSEVPVYFEGIELIPTVLDSRVDFRISGRKQIVATVALESHSSHGYVPVALTPEITHKSSPVTGSFANAEPFVEPGRIKLSGGMLVTKTVDLVLQEKYARESELKMQTSKVPAFAILDDDITLQNTLDRWAKLAGWEVHWKDVPEIKNPGYVNLPGRDFFNAAEYVLGKAKIAAKDAGIDLVVTAYPNHVLVISKEVQK